MGRIKEEEEEGATFIGYYLHNEAARPPPLRLLLFKGADLEKFSVQVLLLIELNKKPQLITYCFSPSPPLYFVFNTAFYTVNFRRTF